MADEPAARAPEGLIQIGDLARRLGVSVDTLRAWERRYGLLHPQRSPGGFRLYSSRDQATVRAMIAEMDRGFPPAQAARVALARPRPEATPGAGPAEPPPSAAPVDGGFTTARAELRGALTAFDGRRAHQLMDGLFAEFTLDAVLDQVVLPCLRRIGDGWAGGEITVGQEHFASNLLRERLLGLSRPWDRGSGPAAVLACPPDERHDIGLISFGLVLGRSGWRITFLGADTPIPALAEAAGAVAADLAVIASVLEGRLDAVAPAVRELAASRPVALAGKAATAELARSAGARLLAGPPVAMADRLAAGSARDAMWASLGAS